jgi:hypothetical protein
MTATIIANRKSIVANQKLPRARSCKMKRSARRAVSRAFALDDCRTPPGARQPSPAPAATQLDPLDAFVDPQIRLAIEQTYCARINQQCGLSEALKDPLFLEDPGKHVALYSDHGVVHTRDVAGQILEVLDTVHGALIPARDSHRLAWMKAYGVLIAYVHDIGMIDMSPVGRSMHPEYATQAVLGSGFDNIIGRLWGEDHGGFVARVVRLHETGSLGTQAPTVVLREMLAMANSHSKSKVPVSVLNDPGSLRRMMLIAATTDLHVLYRQQRAEKATASGATEAGPGASRGDGPRALPGLADAPPTQAMEPHPISALCDGVIARPEGCNAFAWLESGNMLARELIEDVIDTLRSLRCADALRQRGTVLKTSGNCEIFVDQRTANAIYALRPDDQHLYLLEIPDQINAGEANLSSQLEADGNLRVSFYHGMFTDQEAVLKVARCAALVINDIQEDAVGSFERSDGATHPELTRSADVSILIESVNENPAFADLVRWELQLLNPVAASKVRVVTSLEAGSALERRLYTAGTDLDWDLARRREALLKVARCGHRTEAIDPVEGFREVRRIELRAGDTLIEAGTPSGFVYIPLGEGLRGLPLGGYQDFAIQPWMFVGVTGVIRGAIRNAKVVAERDLDLLVIPKGVFLEHWHFTYDQKAFAVAVSGLVRSCGQT